MRGQKVIILQHLKTHGSLTSLEAFENYGVTRLAAVIFELRKLGHDIVTLDMEGSNRYGESVRYAKYVLKGEADGN